MTPPSPDASADPDPDAPLARRAASGDHAAFSELVTRHKLRIHTLATRFTRHDHHQTQDLCQDIFLSAWTHLPSYRHDAPFPHWLARIATRKCLDWLRKNRHRSHDLSLDLSTAETPEPHDPRPARDESARHAHETLHRALAQLDPEDRLVITLLELEELPVATIATHTGWTESKVKVRAHRARHKLRQILQSE